MRLCFVINKYRIVAVQGKLMEIATFLPTAAGQFCLLSYWIAAGMWAFPSGFPILFKNCTKAFQQPLGISQRLSYTLGVFPSGCPTTSKSSSQRLSAKMWQFPALFSEGLHFCLHFFKVEGTSTIFKYHQRLL